MSQLIALMVAIFLPAVLSYREFLSLLPNGQNVPDPCNPGTVWEGVGHLVKEGKSKRNAFGKDFHKYGKMWSKELCRKDSDGDGKTNGFELGDPDCTWTPGSLPKGPSLSHPGICEPLESEQCKTVNSWLNCNIAANYEMGQFCPHINNKTITRDLRLSPTLVPEKETTYYCQLFDLRLTSDHHMVATQPLITTKLVVHHVLLFGCNPRESLENVTRSPYLCDMVPHTHCNSLIGAWTIGSPGECAHPEMGFRIGPNGYKTVALQVHWNNAHLNSSITDNSGLRIYLTSALRKHDAGMLVIGQNFLQIDPAQDGDDSDLEFSSSCPERCTQVMIYKPIYITSAVNHMHYLGKGQNITIYKNNTLLKVVTDQENYKYDDPLIYNFQNPIQVNPGDELRTTCIFRRTFSPSPVCWGDATSDEMCFGFITYFPLLTKLSHPWCTSHRSIPSCDRHLPGLKTTPIEGCNWWEFRNSSHPNTQRMFQGVYRECFTKGHNLTCTDRCKKAVSPIVNHPCFKGHIGSYMLEKFRSENELVFNIIDAVVTCSCVNLPYCDRKFPSGELGLRQSQFCNTFALSSLQTSTPGSTSSQLASPSCIIFTCLVLVGFYFKLKPL
ncbi:uncharacterized protein LOC106071279 isoform X2 [Biomphalaria glabrata]|nr:uncharacterized protein LOC106071279 isoform X2 [Biomphalaria glabrata]XP_055897880.1 uncharacterized protein LOC106071279 isoform X2 [Biomphalaria glabrata]